MNFIKKKRLARGLSQKELAEKLGTHQERISKWETGRAKPSLSYQREISEVLDIEGEKFVEELHGAEVA